MTIEALLQNLIAAINANTAALGGKVGKGETATDKTDDAGEEKKTTSRGRRTSTKSDDDDTGEEKKTTSSTKKITREALTTIMNKVKEDLGTPEAKAIIKKMGVERLAEIEDEDIAKTYKLAEAALAKADEAGSGSDDDI